MPKPDKAARRDAARLKARGNARLGGNMNTPFWAAVTGRTTNARLSRILAGGPVTLSHARRRKARAAGR